MSIELRFEEQKIISRIEKFDNYLREKRLGSDIDNTEIATSESGLKIVNRRYGTSFKLSDLTYDFAIVDLIAKHIPNVQNPRQEAIDIWNSDENSHDAHPMPGALIVSKHLADSGINQIHRITQRPGRIKNQTLTWYKAKMPWVDRSLIHIQPNEGDYDELFKVNQVGSLDIELFFEDSIPQAEMIVKQTNAKIALIPQDSNKDYKSSDPNRIIVVPDTYNPELPAFVRTYLYLADTLV